VVRYAAGHGSSDLYSGFSEWLNKSAELSMDKAAIRTCRDNALFPAETLFAYGVCRYGLGKSRSWNIE
jgi:hypothetical protein